MMSRLGFLSKSRSAIPSSVLIVQFAGAVSAVQLRLVPELGVPEAADPACALGLIAQLFASVVTSIEELGPEVP
jgi:hypothetical protein